MFKYITIAMMSFCLVIGAKAQVVVKWSELNKDWYINSGGYPADEPVLDSLYFRLHDFKLQIKADSTYKMTFSKESFETGKYSVNKMKRELVLKADKTGKILAYSVAELTPDVLLLTIGEKYTWAYYLSLTPHQ